MRELFPNLPQTLSKSFKKLWQDVVNLHAKWNLFQQLYGEQESVAVLKETAPWAFRTFQLVLLDDILLSICRLTDPAQQGGNTNLTLAQLIDCIDPDKHGEFKQKVSEAYSLMADSFTFARGHRNRRIAHTDLATYNQPKPLPDIDHQKIAKAIEDITTVMSMVELHINKSSTSYSNPPFPGTGADILFWLRKGLAATEAEEQKARGNVSDASPK